MQRDFFLPKIIKNYLSEYTPPHLTPPARIIVCFCMLTTTPCILSLACSHPFAACNLHSPACAHTATHTPLFQNALRFSSSLSAFLPRSPPHTSPLCTPSTRPFQRRNQAVVFPEASRESREKTFEGNQLFLTCLLFVEVRVYGSHHHLLISISSSNQKSSVIPFFAQCIYYWLQRICYA